MAFNADVIIPAVCVRLTGGRIASVAFGQGWSAQDQREREGESNDSPYAHQ